MRPRQSSLGNRADWGGRQGAYPGFNEAEAIKPRKLEPRLHRSPAAQSFNEAEAIKPRKLNWLGNGAGKIPALQ